MRVNSFGTRAYSYVVTEGAAELPISLNTARNYLKLRTSAEDDLINLLIVQATDFAEKFTGRDFIIKTYRTYRDFFPFGNDSEGYYLNGTIPTASTSINAYGGNLGFQLKKSPVVAVIDISYLVNGISTSVDPDIYYVALQNGYSEVLTNPTETWPTNADTRLQSITIDFFAGYGNNEGVVPAWAKLGMLQHIAFMFENRGDCVDIFSNSCDCLNFLPATAKSIYLQNRIVSL